MMFVKVKQKLTTGVQSAEAMPAQKPRPFPGVLRVGSALGLGTMATRPGEWKPYQAPAPPDEPIISIGGDLDEYMQWLDARIEELDARVIGHEPTPKTAVAFAGARVGWNQYRLEWKNYSAKQNMLKQSYDGVKLRHRTLEEWRARFKALGVNVPDPAPMPNAPWKPKAPGGPQLAGGLIVAGVVVAAIVAWRVTR